MPWDDPDEIRKSGKASRNAEKRVETKMNRRWPYIGLVKVEKRVEIKMIQCLEVALYESRESRMKKKKKQFTDITDVFDSLPHFPISYI